MPLYDYACDDCGHTFEARHGFDDPAPACPNCASAAVSKRITSAPGVARGMLTAAGTSRRSSKEELKSKWAEETPKLRRKLEDKLGRDVVRKTRPRSTTTTSSAPLAPRR